MIFNNLSIFEVATNSFFFRTTINTSKLLKDAQLSVTKGDKQKALELARKAKQEAALSYAEAVNQDKNWSEPDYLSK